MGLKIEKDVLVSVDGIEGELTVPEGVKEIAPEACMKNGAITKVILPPSVKKIGYSAFSGCYNLQEINLESIEEMGYDAFASCRSLCSIELNCAEIPSAFGHCFGLTEVKLHNTKSIDWYAFQDCKLKEIILPDTLEEIGNNAFSGCEFNSVVIPKSVKEVEEYAFSDAHEIMVYDNIQSNIYQIAQKQELVREGIKYYTLKILSAETGELKYCIAMIGGRSNKYMTDYWVLTPFFEHGLQFDNKEFDNKFKEFKNKDYKVRIALNRLKYPIDLGSKERKGYETFLKKWGSTIYYELVENNDVESMEVIIQVGAVKVEDIDTLLFNADFYEASKIKELLAAYKEKQNNIS